MTTQTMIHTARFGEIAFEAEDIVLFQEGLVGLEGFRRFVLIQHKEGSPFRWLQSLDDGSFALLVIDPCHYVSDFAPDMPESATSALGLTADTPILVYTICSIPNGNPQGMTLNLAGPIVLNAETREARQVVLDDETYPVRFSVFGRQEQEAA